MTDVVMPQMGESIVEGTLTRWLKKPGDKVERDEPLFEISTDKVDTEIPSPTEGVLSEVLVQEGATVEINAIVARIGGEGEGGGSNQASAAPPAEQQQKAPQKQEQEAPPKKEAAPPQETPKQQEGPQQQQQPPSEVERAAVGPSARAQSTGSVSEPPQPQPVAAGPYPVEPEPQSSAPPAGNANGAASGSEDSGPLSPLVRKMAREFNIDLSQVEGTGAGGRITKQDVESYMSSQGGKSIGAAAPQPAGAGPYPVEPPPASAPQHQPPSSGSMPVPESAKTRIEPMSTMRQKIAEHMVMSKRTSAHVTTVHKVDMTKIARLRDKSKAEFQARNGFSLTFLPFVTAATVEAIRTFPIFNASIDGKNVVYFRDINIGIAVALENGLIVPVIRNADEKNVAGLQRSIVDLATRARSRQLKPDEVAGGTFSITNFGSFGSIFATPVINQPQVAILGVGAVEKLPVVVEGDAIAIRSQAHLALTFDHRLIDGALADQFCQKVKSILENWSTNIL